MFGLGFWEIVIIVLVAVILIKPSDLPAFLRKAGRWIGKVQAAYDELQRAIHRIDEERHSLDPLSLEPASKEEDNPGPRPGDETAPVKPKIVSVRKKLKNGKVRGKGRR